ncbi:lipopolysaccharide biosynthesis protein [Bilifractor porci]|uniref:Oligosaccharide flippase family protein n=1 Tax=Bilifractor porci TaxID=2606636 RepID=A0A7X2P9A0_9FIRM|nr:polysaccharide biosynthesis C-terminal domain-containing protein [Bilifractor porci]MST82531.1 oligosaccharide flippase family protein [Bilifractor porci]
MRKQGKYKYLAKNIGLLTLSNFATKLLSFFLVPLYTSILTTADYGIYDLFNTTVGVLLPILTLNVQEGMLRFAMEKDYNREAIVTVGIRHLLIGSAITAVGLGVNGIFGVSSMLKTYAIFFFLMFFVQALGGIVPFYIRGIDRIGDLSISSVVASAVTIGCNILFLVGFRWGLIGYFLANIVGPLVQCIWLATRAHMFRDTHLTRKYKKESNELLDYSRPLIANSIAWWVNNASDRYVVTFFCGVAANGVYSVASKIPSILNVFQTIFNQAWALSAVKDYDPEDKSGFFANTYRAYNCTMTIVCSAIIVLDKILAKFLYAKDFYVAWRYVPWLTMAILFGAMSGYIGGFFTAVKDSKIYATSTAIGAVTNIILNLVFTPILGALGAAIATTVCYVEVYAVRLVQSRKYIKLRINFIRDIISYILLAVQSIVLLFVDATIPLYGILVGLFVVICIMYIKDIGLMVRNVLHR